MEPNLFMIKRKASRSTPDSNEDFQQLEGIDGAVDSLLGLGKLKKALDCMNQALTMRINVYGDSSKEVIHYLLFIFKKSCAACAGLIERGKIKNSIEIMRNLLALANNYHAPQISLGTCEVYNTLSCALRKQGKPLIAKKYAMKALILASSLKHSEKISSSIYLNLCAIFSSLDKHKEASIYCSQAVHLAQEDLLNLKLSNPDKDFNEEVGVLAVAYHNLGVEEEYLRHYEEALAWYRKAIKFLENHSSPTHLNMLEEFKKNYEDALKTCKKKFKKIRLEESLKEDYFYEEASYSASESEFHLLSKNKSSYGVHEKPFYKSAGIPRVPSIPALTEIQKHKKVFRSESNDSFKKTSERHRRLLELDSDIRELDNLGLLEHDKQSSRRSKSSFRSEELSPISNQKIRVRGGRAKQGETRMEYKEKKEQAKTQLESVRKRKVIREDSGKVATIKLEKSKDIVANKEEDFKDQLERKSGKDKADSEKKMNFELLKAVLRIQSYFRTRRIRRWFQEVKEGSLYGTMLKCEKVINSLKYLVSFKIEKNDESPFVLIEAQPLNSLKVPIPGKYSLFDVCTILNTWTVREFETRKSELLIYTTIEKNQITLKKNNTRIELLYQSSKQLNNMFAYQISIYNVVDYLDKDSLLIDGKPLKKSPKIVRAFLIPKQEIANILRVKLQALQQNLNRVVDLVIIEGEGELSLSRRWISDKIPSINVVTTNTDEHIDKYKLYESSSRAIKDNMLKPISFVSSKSDLVMAAVRIQKAFKGKRERNKLAELKNTVKRFGLTCSIASLNKAVVMLQAFARRWKARRVYLERKKEQEEVERKKNESERVQREIKAVVLLQRYTKVWLFRKRFPHLVSRESLTLNQKKFLGAVVAIQSKFRGWVARKAYKTLKNVSSLKVFCAVSVIQRHAKRWIQRRRQKALNSSEKQKSPMSNKRNRVENPIPITKQLNSKADPKKDNGGVNSSSAKMKALLVIQKFVKGWKQRREFLAMKKSAINIQKNFRGWAARKAFTEEKSKKMNAVLIISAAVKKWLKKRKEKLKQTKSKNLISKLSAAIIIQKNIKAFLAKKSYLRIKALEKELDVPATQLNHAAISMQKGFRGYQARKEFNFRKNFAEFLKGVPTDKITKSISVIQARYKAYMTRKKFYSLISAVKKAKSGTSAAEYLKAVTTIQKFARGWKIRRIYGNSNKMEMGKKGKFLEKQIPIKFVIRMQAAIRAFLTRKRLSQPNLILCIEKIFGSNTYRLFCYYYSNKFQIKAENKVETISLIIEKKLSPSQVMNFLRKKLIPNLSISEKAPRKLIYRPKDVKPSEPQRPKALTTSNPSTSEKLNKKSYVPLNFIGITPNLNISSKSLQKSSGSSIFKNRLPKPHLFSSSNDFSKNPIPDFNYDAYSSHHQSEPLSLSTPKIQIPRDSLDQEHLDFSTLILKTGISLSGIYVIVTMQLAPNGIHIQAVNESRLVELELNVTTGRTHGATEKELENLCSELLAQLKIVSNLDGKIVLALIESGNEEKNEVIYKKSHYISSRYFTVTVFENLRGVFLEAQETDRNSFSMKLGRRRVGNSQKVQEEISNLVQKLKIQQVLGQDMLILSIVS